MGADSHLYVSKRCQYSAQLIKFLHENGFAGPLKVMWVDDFRRGTLPRFVDRVPTLTHNGEVYQDKKLKDFFYAPAKAPEDVPGLQAAFGDMGTPIDGPPTTNESWGDFMNFRIECPPDETKDSCKFDLEQFQKARLADVPMNNTLRT